MWKMRYKYYLTKDPKYVITAVSTFKFINEFDKLNSTYKINEIENDSTYKDLYSYYWLTEGHDFIPIAFSDRVSKLCKLPKLDSGIELHWCIGYVSPYLVGGNKALLSSSHKIDVPSYEILLTWLIHHVNKYTDSMDNHINQVLASECLIAYVREARIGIDGISYERYFDLVYNNKVTILHGSCYEWINHLQNLHNRDFYEIIVNDFKK